MKFDLSIDMGHKPVPEGLNATRPVVTIELFAQF